MHRDVKPANFLIGRNKRKHIVYITDYGIAKKYRDKETGEHIRFKNDKGLTGTVRYSSINS